jgi:hypothetical protein
MNTRTNSKATFAEVFGSIKFHGKRSATPSRPWPRTGFAVNKSTHAGESLRDEQKLIRSSN